MFANKPGQKQQDDYESPSPVRVRQLSPSDDGERQADDFSPFKESADTRKEVTEPRRFKKRQDTANSLYVESQHTLPRSKKISKRYFLGEYDATAGEEQSLMNSQNHKRDRADRKTVGSPEEISSFVQNENSSPAQSRGGMSSHKASHKPSESMNQLQLQETQGNDLQKSLTLHALGPLSLINNSPRENEKSVLSSKRVSVIDHMTDNENANSDYELERVNLPSEIKVLDTRKTAENRVIEAIAKLSGNSQSLSLAPLQKQVEEDDDEYEETQTLSIVPHNMEHKPEELIEMFNSNYDKAEENEETLKNTVDQQKQMEQDEIDAEWRMLREQVTYPYLPPLTQLKKLPKFAKDLS